MTAIAVVAALVGGGLFVSVGLQADVRPAVQQPRPPRTPAAVVDQARRGQGALPARRRRPDDPGAAGATSTQQRITLSGEGLPAGNGGGDGYSLLDKQGMTTSRVPAAGDLPAGPRGRAAQDHRGDRRRADRRRAPGDAAAGRLHRRTPPAHRVGAGADPARRHRSSRPRCRRSCTWSPRRCPGSPPTRSPSPTAPARCSNAGGGSGVSAQSDAAGAAGAVVEDDTHDQRAEHARPRRRPRPRGRPGERHLELRPDRRSTARSTSRTSKNPPLTDAVTKETYKGAGSAGRRRPRPGQHRRAERHRDQREQRLRQEVRQPRPTRSARSRPSTTKAPGQVSRMTVAVVLDAAGGRQRQRRRGHQAGHRGRRPRPQARRHRHGQQAGVRHPAPRPRPRRSWHAAAAEQAARRPVQHGQDRRADRAHRCWRCSLARPAQPQGGAHPASTSVELPVYRDEPAALEAAAARDGRDVGRRRRPTLPPAPANALGASNLQARNEIGQLVEQQPDEVAQPAARLARGPEAADDDRRPSTELTGVRKAAILLVQLGKEHAAPGAESPARDRGRGDHRRDRPAARRRRRRGRARCSASSSELAGRAPLHAPRAASSSPQELLEAVARRRTGPREIMDRLKAALVEMPFQFLRRADPRQLLSFLAGRAPADDRARARAHDADQASLVLVRPAAERAGRRRPPHRASWTAPRRRSSSRSRPTLRAQALLGAAARPSPSPVGGVQPLVDIINRSDRATERLDPRGPRGSATPSWPRRSSRMFMFEDIVSLEDRAVQLVLRQVDTKRPGARAQGRQATTVRDKIIANLSERAGREPARGDRAARPGPADAGRGGPGSDHPRDPRARGVRPDRGLAGERR